MSDLADTVQVEIWNEGPSESAREAVMGVEAQSEILSWVKELLKAVIEEVNLLAFGIQGCLQKR